MCSSTAHTTSSAHSLTPPSTGRNGFVVRVVHRDSGARGLLKDFTGAVVDLAFAHAGSDMLACIDQGGNIHVFKVAVEGTAVVYPGGCMCVGCHCKPAWRVFLTLAPPSTVDAALCQSCSVGWWHSFGVLLLTSYQLASVFITLASASV